MVWAGVCYGQRTQVHFLDGILNAQRYRDKILRPIVVPFIHDHQLMLQHDNARLHVARICSQFLEAENIPILARPAYSPDMSPLSMFGMLWIGVYILDWPFIVASLRHTCSIITLSNQHLDMPHLTGSRFSHYVIFIPLSDNRNS